MIIRPIIDSGGRIQILGPLGGSPPESGVGSWGVGGAPDMATALRTNDGDTSFVQNAAMFPTDMACKWQAAQVGSVYIVYIVMRKGAGSAPNGVDIRWSNANPDFTLGAGSVVDGAVLGAGLADTDYHEFSAHLTTIEGNPLLLNHGNFWLNMRAGVGNAAVFNVTQVRLEIN